MKGPVSLSGLVSPKNRRRQIYTIAIASGKGGVGKTTVAINLSLALCRLKQKVILMDGDLGLGNVTFMLGLKGVKFNLEHVIDGEKRLDEIILEGPEGLQVIPSGSGVEKLANLTGPQSSMLWSQFKEIETYGDFLIVDLAAGIADAVMSFLSASESAVIITTPGKTAILDAYAILKVLHRRDTTIAPLLFINQYQKEAERTETTNKLKVVVKQFLDLDLIEIGAMKKDWRVEKALNTQEPFVLKHDKSDIARSMYDLAEYYIKESHRSSDSRIKTLFGR